MFEDKIEAMNKLPNAVDDSSGFEKRVYTVEEIMDILSIGKNTAYALVNSGVFHFVKVGGRRALTDGLIIWTAKAPVVNYAIKPIA